MVFSIMVALVALVALVSVAMVIGMVLEVSTMALWVAERGRGGNGRGGRYIDDKLSKADKSVFLKSSATYRYRKMEVLKLWKDYRYRKMHQILANK